MATYNQPVIPEPFDWYQGNFGTDEEIVKTERDEGAGIFTTLKIAILNLGPDLATELGYVADMLAHPIDTGKILLKAAAGYAQKGLPDAWEAYLPSDWATNKIYAEAINQHYIERYGSLENAADAFAEKPVSVLLDVFIVKSILTAAARQAKKLTVAVNNTLNSAKGTVMEGEIATKANAIKQANNEVQAANERVIIEKGMLVFDKNTGVYVPVSSVGESTKAIEVAEAAGGSVIIAGEVVHIPKPAPVVAEAVAAAEVGARVSQGELIKLAENVKAARQNVRTVKEKWDAVEGDTAIEAFYQKSVKPAEVELIRAEIAVETAVINNAIIDGKTSLAAGAERTLRDKNVKLIAIEQEVAGREAAVIYNKSLTLEELTKQAELFPVASAEAQANMIRNGQPAEVVAAFQKTAAEIQAAIEARTAEVATIGKQGELFPQVVNQAQRAVDERMLSGTTNINTALKAETAALSTEAAEAIAAAKRAAGDMYPNVAGTGMVASQAADLSVLPNFSRLAKAAEIDDLARISKTAETVKAGELATQYAQRGDMYPVVKASELTTVGKSGELAKAAEIARIPNITRPWKAAEISQQLPLQAIARTVKLAETAGNLDATTGLNLQGQRGVDGSLYPADIHPDIPKPPVTETIPAIKSTSRPGWMQGNTHAPNDGNWWSADFDDEYWNTPAGVNEAISIWGRPIGTRHSWETPAAIKNQYTYRQQPDWSWMDEYN